MTRENALRLRGVIEKAVQSLDDNTALTVVNLYPSWSGGTAYEPGYKVRFGQKLYRCVTGHTSQADWSPDAAATLWEVIDETHTGTLEDPIPYDGNMALTSGLHYIQDGAIYRCTADTINPVYQSLRELVGIYTEEV